jgi:hypothetical protein
MFLSLIVAAKIHQLCLSIFTASGLFVSQIAFRELNRPLQLPSRLERLREEGFSPVFQ